MLKTCKDGAFESPGFIDIQVNGFAGADYNSPSTSLEEIAKSLQAMFTTGVTRLLPTVITGSPENMIAALRNLQQARQQLPEGRAIAGFHVEGPNISPEDGPRGAHPVQWVRPPDIDEYMRWQEATNWGIRLVTLAPEWPGAPKYIEHLTSHGVVVSVGHTAATAAQLHDAVSAGARLSTHLGNGAHAMLPRWNYIWEQVWYDGWDASFIVDGHHLPDAFFRVALRTKGIDHCILITDAVAPAMCAPGPYKLGEVDVELKEDGRVVLRGGNRLAGSSLRMDHAIANAVRIGGISLEEAITMATMNPALLCSLTPSGSLYDIRDIRPGGSVKFRFENGRLDVIETHWL